MCAALRAGMDVVSTSMTPLVYPAACSPGLTEALKGGFADSIPFQLFAPRMAAQDYADPLGATDTMIKDLDVVEQLAGEAATPLPMTTAALSVMRSVSQQGDGDSDISTIVKYFLEHDRYTGSG